MKIQIGIQHLNREIELDVAQTAEEIQNAVASAISEGHPLVLSDVSGKSVIIPEGAIGYVSMAKEEPRRVGFGFAN